MTGLIPRSAQQTSKPPNKPAIDESDLLRRVQETYDAFHQVVTEVVPVGPFWEAEPEHQDYLLNYPNGYTCHFVRPNWKLPRRAANA